MMLPVALLSVLAGSSAGVAAPDAQPPEMAPAPAPAPAAPAPATASSITVTVVTTPAATTTTTQTVVVGSLPSEPAPAPVVVVTPPPAEPPIVLSPPAPTWTPVQPPRYVPPDDARVYQTMRQHRRAALGAFVVGGIGMGATLGFQTLRIRGLQRCAAQGSPGSSACDDAEAMDFAFSRYGALGMAMLVAGTGGAGALLGNAAATRDVQLRGLDVRPRNGLKVLGVAAIGIAAGWMIGANMRLGHLEFRCADDPSCLLRYRPLRLAANDGAALGVAFGAGLVGYAAGYERQGRALMRLRATPSLSARQAGVAVAVEF